MCLFVPNFPQPQPCSLLSTGEWQPTRLDSDPQIVEELLLWLCNLLAGRVPPEVVTTSALLLADAVEPEAPRGADLLRHAAGHVASPGQAGA